MQDKSSSNTTTNVDDHKFVSDWDSFLVQLTFFVFLCLIVSIIGMVTNTINIIVFLKQRAYRQCGIVNLLGLSVSDLLCVISTFYNGLCVAIFFIDPSNIPWDPYDVMYISGIWPHLMFVQVTRVITAFVALERCICVVWPFKAKAILTPNRSIAVITCLFIIVIGSHTPIFVKQQLKVRSDPFTNVTKLILVSSSGWLSVVDVMWYINTVTFNQGTMVIVLICTLCTVARVRKSKQWRDSVANGRNKTEVCSLPTSVKTCKTHCNDSRREMPQKLSSARMQKEKRLVATITLISVIFLVCYIPDFIIFLMYLFQPEIRVAKKYSNLAWLMYSLTFFMDALNSSINILVYYKMSTKFKEIFRQLIGLSNEK